MRQAPRPPPAVGASAIRAVRAQRPQTAPARPRQPALRRRTDGRHRSRRAEAHPRRRPRPTATSAGPARQPLHQRRIARGIGRNRDQRRIERARIGQPCAGRRPRSAAACVTAWMIGPCVPSTVRTTGASGGKSLDLAQRSIASLRQPDGKIRFMRDAPAAGPIAARAEQLRLPCRSAGSARIERIGDAGHARDPPAHPCAAEVRASPPSRTSQQGATPRSAATASRRVAVKSSAAGSPHSSPITPDRPEHLTPSSIAHSAVRASRAST